MCRLAALSDEKCASDLGFKVVGGLFSFYCLIARV
jgi:hypothetical protein